MIYVAAFIVRYERKACIGAAICAAADAENWVMNADGKADLVDGTLNEQTQMWEKEIDETGLDSMKAAAGGCPALVIHIFNKETGEKIAP